MSTKWVDYVEEPMKYQALRHHFFSMGRWWGGWVMGWGFIGWVVGGFMGWVVVWVVGGFMEWVVVWVVGGFMWWVGGEVAGWRVHGVGHVLVRGGGVGLGEFWDGGWYFGFV